jgi:Aminopeptidase P, N-terminal domain
VHRTRVVPHASASQTLIGAQQQLTTPARVLHDQGVARPRRCSLADGMPRQRVWRLLGPWKAAETNAGEVRKLFSGRWVRGKASQPQLVQVAANDNMHFGQPTGFTHPWVRRARACLHVFRSSCVLRPALFWSLRVLDGCLLEAMRSQLTSHWKVLTTALQPLLSKYVHSSSARSVTSPTACAPCVQLLAEDEVAPGVTFAELEARRGRLAEALPAGALAILPSAPQRYMTGVIPYPYRQDADFRYFTGLTQEGVALFHKPAGGGGARAQLRPCYTSLRAQMRDACCHVQ